MSIKLKYFDEKNKNISFYDEKRKAVIIVSYNEWVSFYGRFSFIERNENKNAEYFVNQLSQNFINKLVFMDQEKDRMEPEVIRCYESISTLKQTDLAKLKENVCEKLKGTPIVETFGFIDLYFEILDNILKNRDKIVGHDNDIIINIYYQILCDGMVLLRDQNCFNSIPLFDIGKIEELFESENVPVGKNITEPVIGIVKAVSTAKSIYISGKRFYNVGVVIKPNSIVLTFAHYSPGSNGNITLSFAFSVSGSGGDEYGSVTDSMELYDTFTGFLKKSYNPAEQIKNLTSNLGIYILDKIILHFSYTYTKEKDEYVKILSDIVNGLKRWFKSKIELENGFDNMSYSEYIDNKSFVYSESGDVITFKKPFPGKFFSIDISNQLEFESHDEDEIECQSQQ